MVRARYAGSQTVPEPVHESPDIGTGVRPGWGTVAGVAFIEPLGALFRGFESFDEPIQSGLDNLLSPSELQLA